MESAWLADAAGDGPLAVLRVVVEAADRAPAAPAHRASPACARSRRCAARAARSRTGRAAIRPRRVLLAAPRSFCAGVDRAIEIVELALEQRGAPVYVRKQIVHNEHVVADLERRGAVFVDELDEVPEGATAVFSAHGVSPAVRAAAGERRLDVIDADVPAREQGARRGAPLRRRRQDDLPHRPRRPRGDRGHVRRRPRRTCGSSRTCATPSAPRRPTPAASRTSPRRRSPSTRRWRSWTSCARASPSCRGRRSDDICYATANRQQAVREIARDADVVLVAGSQTSSNSQRLVEVAEREGARAHLVDDETEVDVAWLADAAHRRHLGRRLRARAARARLVGRARRARRRRGRGANDDRRVPAFPASQGGGARMSIPVRQSLVMGRYLLSQKLHRREKFPLLVELEPLFQCNLACSFCGKIQYPQHILKQRMPVEKALAAIEECGAPMVSIAGGEPLVHPEVHVIAQELIARRKFVYLCTNAILMKKKLDHFEPSPYFAWVVHLDGLQERHDEFVERDGIFDKAVDGDPRGEDARLPREHEHDVPLHRHAEDGARRARLPERRARGRRHPDLARVRVREGARPGALPRRRRRRARCSARRSPTAAASAGGSTTRRSSSTSSRARSTSSARRGASRATRSSAGSGRAT